MKKKNLFVFDIDDTLTKSETQHQTAYVNAMKHFGIVNINQNWKKYLHHTDSYILKKNFEANLDKEFTFSFINSFEEVMTKQFLTLKKTIEIKNAAKTVNYLLKETNYAVCFATGSLLKPAFVKLTQAKINFIPELVMASNSIFERENIVKKAIEKAQEYYNVRKFENIISAGDGLWDVKTARNLGIHFLGVNDKNLMDFKTENVKSYIKDWNEFDLQKIEKQLEII